MPQPSDERIAFAARLFLLVLLPFFFGFWVLPHTQYATGQELLAPSASRSASFNSISYSFTGAADVTPQKIDAIFPLADFLGFYPFVETARRDICFQDQGSYLQFPDGNTAIPEFQWVVGMSNNHSVLVFPSSTNCSTVEEGSAITYVWIPKVSGGVPSNLTNSTLTFVPQTRTYPRVLLDFGLLQGLILIPVAYLLVWYPAAGILKKLHKGMAEQ